MLARAERPGRTCTGATRLNLVLTGGGEGADDGVRYQTNSANSGRNAFTMNSNGY